MLYIISGGVALGLAVLGTRIFKVMIDHLNHGLSHTLKQPDE